MSEQKAEYTSEEIEKREKAKKDNAIVTRLAAMFEANKDTVGVPKIFVDICKDLEAAMVLDELFFWTLPKKGSGKTSLRVRKAGVLWLAVRRQDWWDRKRLSVRQADNAISKLIELGFVEKDVFLFNGKPTTHLRLKMTGFIPLYLENLAKIIPEEEEDSETLKNDINDLYEMMGASISPNGNPISPNRNMLISPNGNMINSTVSVSTTSIEKDFSSKKRTHQKKGDLVDGMIHFAEVAQSQGIDKTEACLCELERGLKRNIPRTGQWQDLAKWILKQPDPLSRYLDWYMNDFFRIENAWRMTPEQVRNSWPTACPPKPPAPEPKPKEPEPQYVKNLNYEKWKKEHSA